MPRRYRVTIPDDITELPGRPRKPYAVRWRVNGQGFWEGFPTKFGANSADAFRSLLIAALETPGVTWNMANGYPSTIEDVDSQVMIHEFARTYLERQWPHISPRTRQVYAENLAYLILAARTKTAPKPNPGWVSALTAWLHPTATRSGLEWPAEPLPRDLERWLGRYGLVIGDLDRAALSDIDSRLRLRFDGTLYASSTASHRIVGCKTFLRFAVDQGLLTTLDWPTSTAGAKSKAKRVEKEQVSVPSVAELRELIAAVRRETPASHRWQVMSALSGFAGLRPSEAAVLCVEDFRLPEGAGFGQVSITRALNDTDGWGSQDEAVGLPKTSASRRLVELTPEVVAYVKGWIEESGITSGELFKVSTGGWPAVQHWGKALRRAREAVGMAQRLSPYDLRHCTASHWARVMPPAESARQLGHSVETAMRWYIHAEKESAELRAVRQRLLSALYDSQDLPGSAD